MLNPDGNRQLQWSANRPAFFAIDRQHVFNIDNLDQEAPFFATARFNGDGHRLHTGATTRPPRCPMAVRKAHVA